VLAERRRRIDPAFPFCLERLTRAAAPDHFRRAIPLPDTVGANFAVSDTLTGRSAPADYDFLIGTWRFTFQARLRDGSFTPPFTGHWVFTRKQTGGEGVLIELVQAPPELTATLGARG